MKPGSAIRARALMQRGLSLATRRRAQRWAFEIDTVGAMDNPVENGVGQVGSPITASD